MSSTKHGLWEFRDQETMLSHLIGKSFGENPREKIDQIREEKRKMAAIISRILALTGEKTVLEIGSGAGFVSRNISPLVRELHCCDVSESFLRLAEEECRGQGNVRFHRVKSADLSCFGDGSLDAAYGLNVFIHFNLYDIYSYLKELSRVLKSGGRIWFDIVNSESLGEGLPPLFLEMADLYRNVPDGLPLLVQYNSPAAIVGIARSFGFEAPAKPLQNDPAPWMIFTKR